MSFNSFNEKSLDLPKQKQANQEQTKILYYVQPMIGIGPQRQAEMLVEYIQQNQRKDIDMTIVIGGDFDSKYIQHLENDNIHIVQMPFARLDSKEMKMVNRQGEALRDDDMELRKKLARNIAYNTNPDAIIFHNLFISPNSHDLLDEEMQECVSVSREQNPDLKVYSSMMDIIESKAFLDLSESEKEEFVNRVNNLLDSFLVRADKNIDWFADTFPLFDDVNTTYVGYPSFAYSQNNQSNLEQKNARQERIVISAGGSDLAKKMFETAISACKLSNEEQDEFSKMMWVMLVGPNFKNRDALVGQNDNPNMQIQPSLSHQEYLELLRESKISYSQGGNSTCTDLELSGTASVITPYQGGNGNIEEQIIRAKKLEQMDRSTMITEDELNPELLLQKLKQSQNQTTRKIGIDLNGAKNMIDHIQKEHHKTKNNRVSNNQNLENIEKKAKVLLGL